MGLSRTMIWDSDARWANYPKISFVHPVLSQSLIYHSSARGAVFRYALSHLRDNITVWIQMYQSLEEHLWILKSVADRWTFKMKRRFYFKRRIFTWRISDLLLELPISSMRTVVRILYYPLEMLPYLSGRGGVCFRCYVATLRKAIARVSAAGKQETIIFSAWLESSYEKHNLFTWTLILHCMIRRKRWKLNKRYKNTDKHGLHKL